MSVLLYKLKSNHCSLRPRYYPGSTLTCFVNSFVLTFSNHCFSFLKNRIFSALESDPFFARHPGEELSREKYQELTFLRCKRLFEYDFLTQQEIMENPLKILNLVICIGMYDWSPCLQFFLHCGVSTTVKIFLKYLVTLLFVLLFFCLFY